MFTTIKVAWMSAKAFRAFLQDIDRKGVAIGSDEFFLSARRWVEGPVLDYLIAKQDKGLMKYMKTDNQWIRGIQIFMKSSRLEKRILNAD